MKHTLSACLAILGLLITSVQAPGKQAEPADDTGQAYVSEKDNDACLEMRPDGVFFLRPAPGQYSGGTWEMKRKVITLSPYAGNQITLTRDGETLVDSAGTRWTKPARDNRKTDRYRPVTITVRDVDTGRPVKEFSYDYWIETEAGRETTRWARRKEVHADRGSVTIDAPSACDLTVCVESPDYISGYGNWGIFTIDERDESRSFLIELRRGTTLRGTVSDAVDGKPVVNARVSAIVSASLGAPIPDLLRGVMTDKTGAFVLRGMDPELGISIGHPAYVDFDGSRVGEVAKRTGGFELSARVALEKGVRIKGTVLDSGQNPIEGVMVGGVGLKSVVTGRDGSFSIVSPAKAGTGSIISFTKAGYRGRRLPIPLDTPVVVMESEARIEVNGRVVGPDGAPVDRFEVVLGPGKDPEVWQCTRVTVTESNGCFRLDTPFPDKNWIVIRAEGFAPWEGVINTGRDAVARVIRLSGGVQVRGKFALRGGATLERGEVVLTPGRWMPRPGARSLSIGEAFLAHETFVRPDGSFQIEHVNPGDYVLGIVRGMASPSEFMLSVPQSGIDIGTIEVDGLGTVRGRAFRPQLSGQRQPLQNEYGEIRGMYDPVGDVIKTFATDEKGFFLVSNVPVGVVTIDIGEGAEPFGVAGFNATHAARVCAGRETEVSFNDPGKTSGLSLDITVGDGSAGQCRSAAGLSANGGKAEGAVEMPELLVRLLPPADAPALIPEPVEAKVGPGCSLVGVDDVPPGKYRLEIASRQAAGIDNVLHALDVNIPAGVCAEDAVPVWMTLGAGSIRCRLGPPVGDVANTVITAIEADGAMPPQYGVCDEEGQFCLYFLRPGKYTVWVHSPQRGWARLDGLVVSNSVCDAGVVRLTGGATVKGKLSTAFEKRFDSYEIEAKSSGGVRISTGTLVEGRNGEEYSLDNLWPDEWVVSLSGDGSILRSRKVWVEGRKTVEADLAGKRTGLTYGSP